MIYGYCSVDKRLEGLQEEEWPQTFVRKPEIGEYVESKAGITLEVWRITHTMLTRQVCAEIEHYSDLVRTASLAGLRIELRKGQ